MNTATAANAIKLLSLKPNPEGVPCVFMPDLGGNVLYCRDLVARLPNEMSPWALPLTDQILGMLETITLEELGENFAQVLRDRFPNGPLHLAGFSFAGLLSFETARALARANRPATHVWLFDTRAHRLHIPSALRQAPLWELKSIGSYVAKRLLKRKSTDEDTILHSYRLLTLDLKDRPKAYWPIIRAMHRALSQYHPKPMVDAPLTLFRTKEPPGLVMRPHHLGWGRLTGGAVSVIPVDAEHATIMHADTSLLNIAHHLETHCRTS